MSRLLDRPLRPMHHTGDCANIAHYAERARPRAEIVGGAVQGLVWCEVLCSAIAKRDGGFVRKPVPDYYVTVYVNGRGQVAETKYTPKSKPMTQRLPSRTVARLVREALGAPAA